MMSEGQVLTVCCAAEAIRSKLSDRESWTAFFKTQVNPWARKDLHDAPRDSRCVIICTRVCREAEMRDGPARKLWERFLAMPRERRIAIGERALKIMRPDNTPDLWPHDETAGV